MGDIQEYFVHHDIKSFCSLSISGHHIADAGANALFVVGGHYRTHIFINGGVHEHSEVD